MPLVYTERANLAGLLMSKESGSLEINVQALQEHWRRSHALVVGESISVIPIHMMPPWDAVCTELNWSLYHVSGGYFSARHHGFCGVYRLIALEVAGDLQRPAKLNRLCGQDPTGTLYIGEASNLSSRLNQLRRSARKYRSERSHGAISMLRQITRLDYPEEKLGVALMFTGRHTRSIERDLLNAYINSFGDTPPLNYRL